MKIFVSLLLAIFAGLAVCEEYTSKFDNIDLDEILGSERLLKNYFNCLMDRGPCTADGNELKKVIPDALRTGCEKCSEKQKEGTKKVIKNLMKTHESMFKELEAKYDPEGTYREKYKEEREKL